MNNGLAMALVPDPGWESAFSCASTLEQEILTL